jgi:hypothetical protein
MAALDVGNGPVEGHAISSNSKAALVKNGSRRAMPRACDLPLHAESGRTQRLQCAGFNEVK